MSENKPESKDRAKPEWSPKTEFFTTLSADGKYVICKTVITAIKPRAYFDKVLSRPLDGAGGTDHKSDGREVESTDD